MKTNIKALFSTAIDYGFRDAGINVDLIKVMLVNTAETMKALYRMMV